MSFPRISTDRDWLEAYLNDQLSDSEREELENRLCLENDLADLFVSVVNHEAVIKEWAQSKSNNFTVSSLVKRNRLVSLVTNKLFVATALLLVGLLFGSIYFNFYINQSGATVLKTKRGLLLTQDEKKVGLYAGDSIPQNEKQFLSQGAIELLLPKNVKVQIVSPSRFELTGDNKIKLDQGLLIANVPASGIGFQVDTPCGRIVDLGTTFSVHATEELNTEVKVFRGKVIASLLNPQGIVQSSKQIEKNQAMKINSLKEELVDIPYTSHDFISSIQAKHGITGHSKNVVFQEKMPESVIVGKPHAFEHDDLIFIFPERKNFSLTEKLKVDIGNTGDYKTSKDLLNGSSVIKAGTVVDSFRIYCNTRSKPINNLVTLQGEVRFDRPVLGIIISSQKITKSDQWFCPHPKVNSQQTITHQGVDISSQDKSNDHMTLSANRKIISFQLTVSDPSFDECRVLVESQ